MRISIILSFLVAFYCMSPLSKAQDSSVDYSNNFKALPVQYDFDKIPIEKLSEKIKRQYVTGTQSMLVRWILNKDAVIPKHHHPNEQITWITQGSVEVNSQGKKFTVKAGEVIIFPSNVPHELKALEDTIDIEIFSPIRQDWLDSKPDSMKSKEQNKG